MYFQFHGYFKAFFPRADTNIQDSAQGGFICLCLYEEYEWLGMAFTT